MSRTVATLISAFLVFGLVTNLSYGQLAGLYEFDAGGDGTSWDDATNWEQVLDPDGLPISGDPATPPGPMTSADIPTTGVVIDATMPGQTALDVNVGTANGAAGGLSIGGGDLTVRDLFVGNDTVGSNTGMFELTGGSLISGDDIEVGKGSAGTMTVSDGAASTDDDFLIRADSSLSVTGGTISVGDRLILEDNATLTLEVGDIVADDDFFFFGDSQVTVNGGSMTVQDKLRFDDVSTNGKLTINSGLVRSQEFGFVDGAGDYIMQGVLEINGDGVYQSQAPGVDSPISQLSVAEARALIAEGVHIITSELAPRKLGATSVIVPDFFGNANLRFTQISIVPEPASCVLLGCGLLGLVIRRRRG